MAAPRRSVPDSEPTAPGPDAPTSDPDELLASAMFCSGSREVDVRLPGTDAEAVGAEQGAPRAADDGPAVALVQHRVGVRT